MSRKRKSLPARYFYLKKGKTIEEFVKSHPEFKLVNSWRKEKYFEYELFPEISIERIWVNKVGQSSYRFHSNVPMHTMAIAKLMELYAEGWIEISEIQYPSKDTEYRVTKEEYEMVLRMRAAKNVYQ